MQNNLFGEKIENVQIKKNGSNIIKLENGRTYSKDEVVSALQKEIRRGNEKEAGWWAYLLAKYFSFYYTVRRLWIIAVEDCSEEVIPIINGLMEQIRVVNPKFDNQNLDGLTTIIKIAIVLARSKKDRSADEYLSYFEDLATGKFKISKKEEIPEIPDYALDEHTARGRAMKRFDGFFWRESIKVNNPSPHYQKTEWIRERWRRLYSKDKNKEPKIRKINDNEWEVESFNKEGMFYKVIKKDGKYWCSCPAYQKNGKCKHIDYLRSRLV